MPNMGVCLFFAGENGPKRFDHEGVFVIRFLFFPNSLCREDIFYTNLFFKKMAFIYLLVSRNCLLRADFEGPGNHYGIFRLFDFKISGIISAHIFRFM